MSERILERRATKGGRYEVELVETNGVYNIVFKSNGKVTATACNYPSREAGYASFAKRINQARCIDGINYQRH